MAAPRGLGATINLQRKTRLSRWRVVGWSGRGSLCVGVPPMKLHLGMLAYLCGPAMATPMLRLSTSALVWSAGSAATQTVCAVNAGDGTLALSASVASGTKWLTVAVGSPGTCPWGGRLGIPLQVTIDVSRLAWGTFTASVTVNRTEEHTTEL